MYDDYFRGIDLVAHTLTHARVCAKWTYRIGQYNIVKETHSLMWNIKKKTKKQTKSVTQSVLISHNTFCGLLT